MLGLVKRIGLVYHGGFVFEAIVVKRALEDMAIGGKECVQGGVRVDVEV